MSEYYIDFETEPIGGDNPYYCCTFCKRSVPEINGRLEGHLEYCEYRLAKEKGPFSHINTETTFLNTAGWLPRNKKERL